MINFSKEDLVKEETNEQEEPHVQLVNKEKKPRKSRVSKVKENKN